MLKKIVLWPYYIRLKLIKNYIKNYNDKANTDLVMLLQDENLNKRIAAAFIIIKNMKSIMLHDEQIIAIMSMLDNRFVDVKTGEGKTFIVAAYCMVAPKPIHVVTVNEYLAQYAIEGMKDLYDLCGCSVNLLHDDPSLNQQDVFSADIVYGTPNAYCFKHVIDRFSRELTYKLHTAVIDEADYVLIDNATSSCSVGVDGRAAEEQELIAIDVAIKVKDYLDTCQLYELTYDEEIFWSRLNGKESFQKTIFVCKERKFVDFTQDVIDDIYNIDTGGMYDASELISFAIGLATAIHVYIKMVDYIVVDDKIILIDSHNGRLLPNSKHDFYLDVGLHVKEGIFSITENKTIGSIATQVYFLKYDTVIGLSGSLAPVKEEIFDVFKAKTSIIPKHIKNVVHTKEVFCAAGSDKFVSLQKIVREELEKHRPILVVARDDYHAKLVGDFLTEHFPQVAVFNNEQSYEDEQIYVDNAGVPLQITVSTMLFGRGIDIMPQNDSDLVVVMFEDYGCKRLKQQISGRTGRQGRTGRVYTLISPEDSIFSNLSVAEKKRVNKINFNKYAKKATNRIQSKNYEMRQFNTFFESYFDMIFDYYYDTVKDSSYDDYFLKEMERIKLLRFSSQRREELTFEIMKDAEKVISTIIYSTGGLSNAKYRNY